MRVQTSVTQKFYAQYTLRLRYILMAATKTRLILPHSKLLRCSCPYKGNHTRRVAESKGYGKADVTVVAVYLMYGAYVVFERTLNNASFISHAYSLRYSKQTVMIVEPVCKDLSSRRVGSCSFRHTLENDKFVQSAVFFKGGGSSEYKKIAGSISLFIRLLTPFWLVLLLHYGGNKGARN